ncbi:MAG: SDR family NAD(P)-dependent oxidoreductase [Acidimicrobiales bacterium]
MKVLTSKVAVVTGAANGIGFAMAEAFAAENMKLVLADVDVPGLDRARVELAPRAEVRVVETDVSDPAALERLRDEAVSAFGAVHVVCNNAGVGAAGRVWEVPLEVWRWVFGVNFFGVVHGIRSFVPLMLDQGEGHIVNTSSAAGLVCTPFMGAYSATKHAVVATSETLRMDLAGRNIGVSVLCPLWVRTRIHESERNAPREVVAALAAASVFEGPREVVKGLIQSGTDPAVVAGHVVEAIKEDRFWVLPQPLIGALATRRGHSIAAGMNPETQIREPFGRPVRLEGPPTR